MRACVPSVGRLGWFRVRGAPGPLVSGAGSWLQVASLVSPVVTPPVALRLCSALFPLTHNHHLGHLVGEVRRESRTDLRDVQVGSSVGCWLLGPLRPLADRRRR